MVEVLLRRRPPEAEHSTDHLEERPMPEAYSELTYVVHPTTIDGDFRKLAKERIQSLLDTQQENSRVIIIAPPEQCSYLRPGTIATDIRSTASHHQWALPFDYKPSVTNVTVVGGNLERCLGAVVEGLKHEVGSTADVFGTKRVDITLPLPVIYTTHGVTADDAFHDLLNEADPLEAAIALLTTPQPHPIYANGEFEVIASHGLGNYEIDYNGTPVGSLQPRQEPEEEIPPGWIRFESRRQPDMTYGLHLIGDTQNTVSNDSRTTRTTRYKLEHVKNVVFQKYNIMPLV